MNGKGKKSYKLELWYKGRKIREMIRDPLPHIQLEYPNWEDERSNDEATERYHSLARVVGSKSE